MKKKIGLLALLLLVFSLGYSQNIPHLGSASDRVWGKSQELNLGRATYDNLLLAGRIHQNHADLDYLYYLGHRLGVNAKARFALNFYLTTAPSINAFATPGGYIGLNAGLVLATENEHELAGVLAHEIAHVSQEHIARSILSASNRKIANMAAVIAGILLATSSDSAHAGASTISAIIAGETQQQINDIRRHEIEADTMGKKLLKQAQFSVSGMQSFFAKLSVADHLKTVPAYLLTHPLPIDRQAAVGSLTTHQKDITSSDEYYLFVSRLAVKILNQAAVDERILNYRRSPSSQLQDAGYYLSALQLLKKGTIKASLVELDAMKSSMQDKRDVKLLRAKLYLLNNQSNKALKIYQTLARQYHDDSVVAYEYARFLMSQGKTQLAARLLEKQLNKELLNPDIYLLYGRLLEKLGEKSKQHQILVRYYQKIGNYEKALAQVQIAINGVGKDWQKKSQLEAKQKELQHLLDSQAQIK